MRRVLFTGWGTRDTHSGPSNLRRGLLPRLEAIDALLDRAPRAPALLRDRRQPPAPRPEEYYRKSA